MSKKDKDEQAYTFRFARDEYEAAKRAAVMAGVQLATWVRHLIRRELGLPTLRGRE